jgi:hypothetical protein
MKKLKFILLSMLALSMGVACSEDETPGQKPDDSHELDSLRSMLLGKWVEVLPDENDNVYVFGDDAIYRKNICSELTDTILYQVIAKDSLQITQSGLTTRDKVIAYSTDSIAIADITLKRLLAGEEPECDVILPPCNSGTEFIRDFSDTIILGSSTSPSIGFAQLSWDTEPMPYLLQRSGIMQTLGRICNYPEYAKRWEIPTGGLSVIITGKIYSPSYNHGPNPATHSFYDLELVTLKKKK